MKPERAKLPEPRQGIQGRILAWGGGGRRVRGGEKLLFRESCKFGEKIGGKIFRRYDVFKMEFRDDLRPKNFHES